MKHLDFYHFFVWTQFKFTLTYKNAFQKSNFKFHPLFSAVERSNKIFKDEKIRIFSLVQV